MTRRQKKRAWVFAGVFSTLLGAGVLIGNVYAQSLETEQTESIAGKVSTAYLLMRVL